MILPLVLSGASDLTASDYCVLGLATCFVKEDGEIREIAVLEPIPSAALEAILKGIPTSYQWLYATVLGEIYDGESNLRPLAAWLETAGQYCDKFEERAIAAARTYKIHPSSQEHLPLYQRRADLNYSLERKRVLNISHVVRPEDNVKQHPHTHNKL